MLQEISITNFAIIPELRLSFHEGMTALTGETGAGKSIIIDALGLLAGGRGSSDYIRQGAEKCVLEGLFELPKQEGFSELMVELGIETDEDNLIVRRDMSLTGKNVCRVNGHIITLANLRRIGSYLVDIQGQNEHQELLQSESHLALLDRFGDVAFQQKKKSYQQEYISYRELEKRVRKVQQNEKSYVQRIDMLHFQQEEIAAADLQVGEEEKLKEEREKLSNYQKIADGLAAGYGALTNNEQNSVDGVGLAVSELQGIAHLDVEYEAIYENIQSAYYLLQDAIGDMSRQIDLLELDESRLEEVTQRLELIRQLKRKYGESIESILAYYDEITEELASSDFSEGQLDKMKEELEQKELLLQQQAADLHEARKKIAKELEKSILHELKSLYMENTEFEVRFLKEENRQLNHDGFDQIEFYITTNPGEPLKPLVKVASGGELSRMLLALKTIFSSEQGVTSIIFDEVDTGVSGRVAQAIADKISQISKYSQVLCITHLPQVAAVADYQYYIVKAVIDGRTQTSVSELKTKEREEEIARMLAGSEITKLTLEHAKELLKLAKRT
ncbi:MULTISPECIES: DNA repair protein RecN [Enterococcus]|uniref:DNA repair protein RecN n=2 Tax=Enterococcus TaxID=1350 RepID=A0AB37VYD6_ENTFC|nr:MULTISPECIES: DNA repair protein RecN [Enterococcus]ROY54038.1 DNA repair protein RecN [Enterococcus faecalis]EGP4906073.1 DNA repair protein RecN [Enterococcus faecium]EGP5219290.1 DNA repair protein RecN [Enterococcus faecium]EGP5274797.1 DNA repair protein RecN [Enterococcus faecium]EGP5286981.1 DNA repair protein RecN [Enterococcus faecium]